MRRGLHGAAERLAEERWVRAASTDGHATAATGASAESDAALNRLLDRLPAFRGTARTVLPLVGGLTNHNYRVVTAERSFVARLPSRHGSLLAIDRDAEFHNSRAAASAGVAPNVVAYLPQRTTRAGDESDDDGSLMVIDWVDGFTWTASDVRATVNIARIAERCRTLHAGPRFRNDFDMFGIQRRYLAIVQEHGFRLPARYRDYEPLMERVARALSARPQPTVPCHNDLLAENFIDDGERLWLIDYEYAGNNDPFFELGNIASEAGMNSDQLAELVRCYCGRDRPPLVARALLWALMSQYGWTLWASIQDGVSDIDFDFWGWGMEKYDRAVATFDGPELSRLLHEVQLAG